MKRNKRVETITDSLIELLSDGLRHEVKEITQELSLGEESLENILKFLEEAKIIHKNSKNDKKGLLKARALV